MKLENLRRKNFAPEDFFKSDTAKRLGINNLNLDHSILVCLFSTADLMQEIRDLLGKPIIITSAYRCPELNKAVGSKPSSQHLQGLACDFICPEFGTPEQIVKKIKEAKILVDQCFNENSWVHVSRVLQKDKNRNMIGNYLINPKTKIREFKII